MRILFPLMGGLSVPAINGGAIEQIVEKLATELTQRNNEVVVISNLDESDRETIQSLGKTNVDYKYIDHIFEKKSDYIKYIPQIVEIVKDNSPYDVVHLCQPYYIPLFKLLKPYIGNPKLVWHVHNTPRLSFITDFIKKQDIEIVGVSEAILKSININPKSANVTIIKNTINTDDFPILTVSQKEKNIMYKNSWKNKFIIGYAGRISPEKGLHVLLNALDSLSEEYLEKIVILIAGSSGFKGSTQSLYERNLFLNYRHLPIQKMGYIDNWELYKFYNICDVLIVPSVGEEAAGQVILEVQSCGTEVLASDIGGIPEYLSPYETTFTPNDSRQLSEKIQNMINKTNNINNNKEKRRSWVLKNFEFSRSVDKWISLYQR